MRKIIHHIRKQPEEIRRHILHILIVICGIILVLLWIYSLGTNFSNPDTQTKMNQDFKPISALKDNLVGGYNSMTNPNTDVTQ